MSLFAPPYPPTGITHAVSTATDLPIIQSSNMQSASTYPAADLAIYIPVALRIPALIRKMFVSSGSTGTGYFDLAVYDAGGTRLIATGSQSKNASSIEKVVDVTDTFLSAGIYYLAIAASNATDTYCQIAPAAPFLAAQGVLTQALSSPTWTPTGTNVLPATATWVVNQTLTKLFNVGMFLEATAA